MTTGIAKAGRAFKVLFQRSAQLAGGRGGTPFHLNTKKAIRHNMMVRIIPGKKPAKKRMSIGAPVSEAKRTQKILGGIRLPRDPEAHNSPREYFLSYPFSSITGMAMLPMAAIV